MSGKMPTIAPNQPKSPSESSDWVCSNCGAVLTGVNNNEVGNHLSAIPVCICAAGNFVCTRNDPRTKPVTGKGGQKKNQGGGSSFPGP